MFAKQALYFLSHTPVHFALVILEMGISQTICTGWTLTAILLILASQVARIIGVGHQHLTYLSF
jgi:hypothetical protein